MRSVRPWSAAASPSAVRWMRKTSRASTAAVIALSVPTARRPAPSAANANTASASATAPAGTAGAQRRHGGRRARAELDDVDHRRRERRAERRCRRRRRPRRARRPAAPDGRAASAAGRPSPRGRRDAARSSVRSAAAISTRPAAASTTESTAPPSSTTRMPRASGRDADVRVERCARLDRQVGERRPPQRRSRPSPRRGCVPSQTSAGAAVPGVSALTATESAASSAIDEARRARWGSGCRPRRPGP